MDQDVTITMKNFVWNGISVGEFISCAEWVGQNLKGSTVYGSSEDFSVSLHEIRQK